MERKKERCFTLNGCMFSWPRASWHSRSHQMVALWRYRNCPFSSCQKQFVCHLIPHQIHARNISTTYEPLCEKYNPWHGCSMVCCCNIWIGKIVKYNYCTRIALELLLTKHRENTEKNLKENNKGKKWLLIGVFKVSYSYMSLPKLLFSLQHTDKSKAHHRITTDGERTTIGKLRQWQILWNIYSLTAWFLWHFVWTLAPP